MPAMLERSDRVHYRPIGGGTSLERTSHVDLLSATGCTIRTPQPPASHALELSVYFGDSHEPLRVGRAQVMWGDWNGFTVEFLDMSAGDQRRLREHLWTMSLQEEERTGQASE